MKIARLFTICNPELDDVILLITNYCNANCSFCSVKTVKNERKSKILPFKFVKKIIKSASLLGCKKLVISGGEPTFFLKEIINLIKFAKENKIPKVVISTNSSFASNIERAYEVIKNLKNAGLDGVQFSYDVEHLKIIPYANYLNGMRTALQANIETNIRMIDTPSTYKINTTLLERLIHDLKGRKIMFIPRLSKLFLHDTILIPLIVNKKRVLIRRDKAACRGRAKRLKGEFVLKDPKEVLLGTCGLHIYSHLVVDWKGDIWACCNSVGSTSKTLKLGNIKDMSLSEAFKKQKRLFDFISLIGLTRLYLYLKEIDNRKLNYIVAQKYTSRSHFCISALDHIPKDNKGFKRYEKTKTSIFLLTNIHRLIGYYNKKWLELVTDKILKLYRGIYNS